MAKIPFIPKLTKNEWAMLVIVFCGTFVAFFNQTTINPALPTIMNDFNIDASTAQWLFSINTLTCAIMMPVNAYLVEKFSIKQIVVFSMAFYSLGCFLTAAGPVFPILLLGRIMQGVGSGVLMPTGMTVLFLVFPEEHRGVAMGMFGLIIGFAPILAPAVSGFVCDNASWHWIYIGTGIAALIVVICGAVLLKHEKAIDTEPQKLDALSLITSTIGFGSLLFGFSEIGSTGFSVIAITSTVVGLIITSVFFYRQTHIDNPMLRVDVFKIRDFRISTLIVCCVQIAVMGNAVIIPLLVQNVLEQPATISGLVMVPGAIIMGVMSPIAGRFFDKHGARGMSAVGLLVLFVTSLIMSCIDENITIWFIVLMLSIRTFGMSIVNMPINTWGVNSLSKPMIPHGTATSSTLRQTAGSLGTALTVSAFSLVYSTLLQSTSQLDAGLTGINSAFFLQACFCLVAFVVSLIFVKNKKSVKKNLSK